ncbi:MAG: metallophosphoesterase family protein [Planctomycetota bacterium]
MKPRVHALPFALLVLLAAGCSQMDRPVGSEGFVITPYLQAAGRSGVTLRWTSARGHPCRVGYGSGELDRRLAARPLDDGQRGGPPHLYRVRLAGLEPGTRYEYRVTCGTSTHGASFRTFPARPEPFTFIAYGDSRSYPAIHGSVARRFNRHRPAFLLHTGDLVSSGAFDEYAPEFFEPLAEVIDHVPVFAARGNHEGDADAYRQLLHSPDDRTWYSFDHGNTHVVCLDSCADPAEHERMVAWCRNDLAGSDATWKIVYYHHPSYDVGGHASRWGHGDLLPIFRKHGVDLILCGHSHSYQRFVPLYETGVNETHPITHVVTGGGGARLHDLERHPYLAAGRLDHHYLVVQVDGAKLSARALTADGRLLDEFALVKKNGELTEASRRGARPESGFDLR